MEQNRLRELEDQCIQDCDPPCTSGCPVHVDIRGMTKAVSRENYIAALEIFRKTVPFPGIISRICDQPCQTDCYRKEVGGAIEVALLERACVEYGSGPAGRELLIPRKNQTVAIIGGGLCGMTAALELFKKGYDIQLYEKNAQLGGKIWEQSSENDFEQIVQADLRLLHRPGITISLNTELQAISEIQDKADAIFLAFGEGNLDLTWLGIDPDDHLQVVDSTFQVTDTQFFAGGSCLHPSSAIEAVSDGKRAAISIDRYLQKVSLTAARTDTGAYTSRLFTSIEGVVPQSAKVPNGTGYSTNEAEIEAKRCLQCECMECVKVCEYLKQFKSYPRKYVREIYNNLTIIKRTRSANKLINSCTLCGLCKEVCPTDLDMGQVNRDARKVMVESKKMPISAHDFALRDMAFSNSDRFASLLTANSVGTCQIAFFPGCQLPASNPEYIPQIVNDLQRAIPDLGLFLGCCGAPAEWAGEDSQFSEATARFLEKWESMGKPQLILACSSCDQILRKLIPAEKITTLWQVFLDQGLLSNRQIVQKADYVVHDPCTSRHQSTWQDGARSILTNLGVRYRELEMSRNRTECCGYGGVAWLANPPLVKDMIERRTSEDPSDYLTYCVMCRDLFAGSGKRTLHLLDLLYSANFGKAAIRKGPDYSQRHENRIRVKRQMEREYHGKENYSLESYEEYKLILTEEMRAKIEDRLILIEDIQRVIEHAETSGEKFINKSTGRSLAYFKPNLITYWVDYRKTGESYEVFNAYSHRMVFDEKGEA